MTDILTDISIIIDTKYFPIMAGKEHRSALDCLLFTQPLNHTTHNCFTLTQGEETVRLSLLANNSYRIILYTCKKHFFNIKFENIFQSCNGEKTLCYFINTYFEMYYFESKLLANKIIESCSNIEKTCSLFQKWRPHQYYEDPLIFTYFVNIA